jgi:hypothetical protein
LETVVVVEPSVLIRARVTDWARGLACEPSQTRHVGHARCVLTKPFGFAEQKGQTYYWNTKSNKTQWAKPKVRGGGAVCMGGSCGSELDV